MNSQRLGSCAHASDSGPAMGGGVTQPLVDFAEEDIDHFCDYDLHIGDVLAIEGARG